MFVRWAALLGTLLCAALPAGADDIAAARFVLPTERYTHGILGDAIEWGGLEITTDAGKTHRVTLPQDHVFEDTAPRLWDVTGDGLVEVVVIETDVQRGGALAIYGAQGKIAETPHIGRSNRWLAPIGAADLDGDGRIEIGYIDRPHLAKTLLLWRLEAGKMVKIAALKGVTNHKIGERDIAGGMRTCKGLPEMIVASANWSRLIAVSFENGKFGTKDLGPHTGRQSFRQAMGCR